MLQVQLALTAAVRSHQENSIGHDQHRVRAGFEGAAVILPLGDDQVAQVTGHGHLRVRLNDTWRPADCAPCPTFNQPKR